WTKLIREGVRPWGNPLGATQFGSCFFMITGFHGLHVSAGVVYLTVVALRVWRGVYDRYGSCEPVEKPRAYYPTAAPGWVFSGALMLLNAGFIVAVCLHLAWERLALKFAFLVPPLCLLILIGLMAVEGDYTFLTRLAAFLR